MSRVKCPYCGYWQEPTPPIVLCVNCYADLSEIINKSRQPISQEEPQTDFKNKSSRATLGNTFKKMQGSGLKLIGAGELFISTFTVFYKRSFTLYPLMFISLFAFMLIGPFISTIGARIAFEEVRAADSLNVYMYLTGILVCLLVSFYSQAAFIIAVSNENCTVGDALSKAFYKFGSYIVLFIIMTVIIGTGFALFLIPGVIAYVFLVFAPFVFAAEDAGVIESFSKSVRYAGSAWLQIFFRLAPLSVGLIFITVFFAYAGGAILWATKNIFAFIFIISTLISIPLVFLAVFIFKIYEDVLGAKGIVPASMKEPILREELPQRETAEPAGVPPFEVLIGKAWSIYKLQFTALTTLNIISYIPHLIHIVILITGYFALATFFDLFEIKGEFGLLAFFVLPPLVLVIFIMGVLIYFIIYALSTIFGLGFYLVLELAYVFAIADETITAAGAIKKARNRLAGYFSWKTFFWDFVVSTRYVLFLPGVTFLVWYSIVPQIFALEKDEQSPMTSLWKSADLVRGFWRTVYRQLAFLRVLPLVVVTIFVLFFYAGLPFYWISGLLLSFFAGIRLPGMLTIYSQFFWTNMYVISFLLFGLFYLPFQKVFLYVLYVELSCLKRDGKAVSR
jgi:hypothetical protein